MGAVAAPVDLCPTGAVAGGSTFTPSYGLSLYIRAPCIMPYGSITFRNSAGNIAAPSTEVFSVTMTGLTIRGRLFFEPSTYGEYLSVNITGNTFPGGQNDIWFPSTAPAPYADIIIANNTIQNGAGGLSHPLLLRLHQRPAASASAKRNMTVTVERNFISGTVTWPWVDISHSTDSDQYATVTVADNVFSTAFRCYFSFVPRDINAFNADPSTLHKSAVTLQNQNWPWDTSFVVIASDFKMSKISFGATAVVSVTYTGHRFSRFGFESNTVPAALPIVLKYPARDQEANFFKNNFVSATLNLQLETTVVAASGGRVKGFPIINAALNAFNTPILIKATTGNVYDAPYYLEMHLRENRLHSAVGSVRSLFSFTTPKIPLCVYSKGNVAWDGALCMDAANVPDPSKRCYDYTNIRSLSTLCYPTRTLTLPTATPPVSDTINARPTLTRSNTSTFIPTVTISICVNSPTGSPPAAKRTQSTNYTRSRSIHPTVTTSLDGTASARHNHTNTPPHSTTHPTLPTNTRSQTLLPSITATQNTGHSLTTTTSDDIPASTGPITQSIPPTITHTVYQLTRSISNDVSSNSETTANLTTTRSQTLFPNITATHNAGRSLTTTISNGKASSEHQSPSTSTLAASSTGLLTQSLPPTVTITQKVPQRTRSITVDRPSNTHIIFTTNLTTTSTRTNATTNTNTTMGSGGNSAAVTGAATSAGRTGRGSAFVSILALVAAGIMLGAWAVRVWQGARAGMNKVPPPASGGLFGIQLLALVLVAPACSATDVGSRWLLRVLLAPLDLGSAAGRFGRLAGSAVLGSVILFAVAAILWKAARGQGAPPHAARQVLDTSPVIIAVALGLLELLLPGIVHEACLLLYGHGWSLSTVERTCGAVVLLGCLVGAFSVFVAWPAQTIRRYQQSRRTPLPSTGSTTIAPSTADSEESESAEVAAHRAGDYNKTKGPPAVGRAARWTTAAERVEWGRWWWRLLAPMWVPLSGTDKDADADENNPTIHEGAAWCWVGETAVTSPQGGSFAASSSWAAAAVASHGIILTFVAAIISATGFGMPSSAGRNVRCEAVAAVVGVVCLVHAQTLALARPFRTTAANGLTPAQSAFTGLAALTLLSTTPAATEALAVLTIVAALLSAGAATIVTITEAGRLQQMNQPQHDNEPTG